VNLYVFVSGSGSGRGREGKEERSDQLEAELLTPFVLKIGPVWLSKRRELECTPDAGGILSTSVLYVYA
jgi:hypothetical protein